MNGKTSWISSSNTALWYNPVADDWICGSVDDLGSHIGGISSTGAQGRSSCPYNVPNDAWAYVVDDSWVIADANDVSIECLTGNLSFWQFKSIILRSNKDEVINYGMLDCSTNSMLRGNVKSY